MDSPANPSQPLESNATHESSIPAEFKISGPNRQKLVLAALLAAITIVVYSPILTAPFLNYDDSLHVTDNPHTRAGLTWDTVKWAFRTNETSDWHPVTWLSHALDCQLFGLSPAGPHAVNLLLHAANAVLLFLLLASATGFLWRSLAVAALFALHPINVESVAWISERKDVLSMFFFLLALAAYGAYVRRPGIVNYLLVTLAYAAALMSKAQVITFPFALLLLDYWPLRRFGFSTGHSAQPQKSFASLIAEKIPWFALSAASALITIRVESEAMQSKYPLWVRLANAAIAYARYLEKAVWPIHLAPLYPHPGLSVNKSAAIVSALVIVAISIAVLILHRHRPYFVGWFWFVGTLVPMIGVVQISIHSMADRFAYIPFLGLFTILSWGAAGLAERWRVPKTVSIAAAAAAFAALAIPLVFQVNLWRSNERLWAHTVAITQKNYTAEDMLASALFAEGKIENAIPHLRQALVYYPNDAMAMLNLATYDQMQGNYASAIAGYGKVVHYTRNPAFIEQAYINSGYAYMSLKQYENAIQDFAAALQAQPTNPAVYRGLGLAEQRSGNLPFAIRCYQQAAALQPDPVDLLLLAQAYDRSDQPEPAKVARAQATSASTNLPDDEASVQRLLTQ
ncbi:MAG: tetratricopeptide repeat protein [Terriglobales bacterium]